MADRTVHEIMENGSTLVTYHHKEDGGRLDWNGKCTIDGCDFVDLYPSRHGGAVEVRPVKE